MRRPAGIEDSVLLHASRSQRVRAFTLIEMLTVITIIAILAALLFPAIQRALQQAEKNKAQATAFQLATALRNFQSEYGTWPNSTAGAQPVSASMVNALIGQDATVNPRGIVFLEVDAKSSTSGGYLGPWKSVYQCIFDQSYTGSVLAPDGRTVPAGAIVWSLGALGSGGTTNDWIKTW